MGFAVDGTYGAEVEAPVATDPQNGEHPLSQEEVDRFAAQLQQLREWLLESLTKLEEQSAGGTAVSVESADAVWQDSIKQRAIADKRLLLHEVTQAFERIKQNTYGRCAVDDSPIPRSLLEELPWARFCASCANTHAHAPRTV